MQESCREMRRTSGSSSLSSLRSLYCGESHYSFLILFDYFDMKRGLLSVEPKKNNRAAASPFSVLFTFSIWAPLLPKGFLLDEVEESWAATGQRFLLLSNTAAKLKHHSPSSAGFFWRPKGKEVEEEKATMMKQILADIMWWWWRRRW